jgi:E3 ubiquitin-protein ligase RFWD2
LVGCGDYDGVVTEYDVERGLAAWERDEHSGRRVWSLDYAPAAAMAASGSDDGTAHVWDPRAPSAGWATARAGGAVLCVEFDPSGGPRLAVGSADRSAAVYDVRALGRGPVARMEGHGRAVTYVCWAAAESAGVVTSAADGTHRLWALEQEATTREVRSYSGHASARSFVGMGVWRDAGLIASGSECNQVFVYDLRWAKPIWVHPFRLPANAAAGFVSAVAWRQPTQHDDAGALIAGGSDGALMVFTCQRRRKASEEAPADLVLDHH